MGGLLDPITYAVWEAGHSVTFQELEILGLSDLGDRLTKLREAGVLRADLRSGLVCPNCLTPLEYIRRNTLLVCGCGYKADIVAQFDPRWFRFSPEFVRIWDGISSALKVPGLDVRVEKTHREIEHVIEIGMLSKKEEPGLRVFLCTRRMDVRPLSEVWTSLVQRQEIGMILHPGLTPEAECLVGLTAASIPMYLQHVLHLDEGDSVNRILQFPRFRREIDQRIDSIKKRMYGVAEEVSVPAKPNLEELSRIGGERFQAPAIGLLHTLGAPETLPKREYQPDGTLLLPTGYWIIDTKSSQKGFTFSTSERDKAKRYVQALEEKPGQSEDGWAFFGEIILTRTGHVDSKLMGRVNDYILASGLRSSLVILSFEGVDWLWKKAADEPRFWKMLDSVNDPVSLLELRPVITTRPEVEDLVNKFAAGKVRLISEGAVKAFWSLIIERNEYFGFRGRRPENIAESVQRTMMNRFMRRLPKSSSEPVMG